jgi:hypothetical protein
MKRALIVILSIFFLLQGIASNASDNSKLSDKDLLTQFENPDMRYRPFVRWWWNGDRVEAEELVRELHVLKDAGIGGVEINPISLPSGSDTTGTKPLKWLSDEWIDMLQVVFDEAEKLGMTCDLLVGSGWPFGAESLPKDQRAEVLLTYAHKVTGGEKLEISEFSIFKDLDPGVTVVNNRRNPALVAAYLVPDPINSLTEAIDVTSKFKGGTLSVDVPKGDWQLYALVRYTSFASVINGAPGAAGSILDHMNAYAVREYLDHMTDVIQSRIGPLSKHLRAFFVDSMELEGSNWTSDFADEFRKRRGYDILPWLPFTMFEVGRLGDVKNFDYGSKKGPVFQEQVNRVRFDFELTKAELLYERFTKVYAKWASDNGVQSRHQAYGRGFFQLESSLAVDIPEGESWTTNWLKHKLGEEMGDEDYRRGRGYTMINKYVSSAAALSGKRLVSAEEMTNIYKVFTTSLEFLKLGSDMSAFSGITHSVWHGFNYSPKEAAFPGWVQYGTYHSEKNTWWPYVHLLNEHRARMSAMLQNADMVTDIAILPANYDMWATMGVQTEPFPVKLNVPYTSLIWEAIHKCGGGANYVSENIIRESNVRNGKLCYGPKEYGTLFLVEVTSTSMETLGKLEEFIKGGGRVFCVGKYPEKSLGFLEYAARDKEIKAQVEKLKEYKDNFILLEKPADGKYLEWYEKVMAEYSMPHSITISNPDRYLLQNEYVTDAGSHFFMFSNASLHDYKETDIIFPSEMTKGMKAWIYSPVDGEIYQMPIDGSGKVHFIFGPAESYLFVFNKLNIKEAKPWSRMPASASDTIAVEGRWQLAMHQSYPDSSWTASLDALKDFKDMKDTTFKNFMGDVTYTITVDLDGPTLPRYINLGKVADICELKVNGQDAGIDWYGERIYDIGSLLRKGENTLEIKITTLMGNYMQTLKDNKVAQRFVMNRKQPYVSAGLIGPVKLYK